MRFRTKPAAATVAVALALLTGASGCGGDDETVAQGSQNVPAAGPLTPPAGTPGVPRGASYDVDASGWKRLSHDEQIQAATDYAADNPTRCKDVDIGAVVDYVTDSYFYDFPSDAPASEVLAEGCDASMQSPADR